MIHERKIAVEWYRPVADGIKTWEVRKADRPEGFRVGDFLRLRAILWSGKHADERRFPPLLVRITYVASGVPGVEPGHVVLGILLEDEEAS